MSPRRFELVPCVARDVTLHVQDDRTSLSPDDDLIEVGVSWSRDPAGSFSVTLDLDEVAQFRDALDAILEAPLPPV